MNTTQTSEENTTAQSAKTLYTAKVTHGAGGGDPHSDGRLDVKLSVPGDRARAPTRNIVCRCWSACFLSAIKLVAAK